MYTVYIYNSHTQKDRKFKVINPHENHEDSLFHLGITMWIIQNRCGLCAAVLSGAIR